MSATHTIPVPTDSSAFAPAPPVEVVDQWLVELVERDVVVETIRRRARAGDAEAVGALHAAFHAIAEGYASPAYVQITRLHHPVSPYAAAVTR